MLDEMLENMQHNSSFGIINRESQGAQGPKLMLDKIKPADRVTFMMNYLYMTIRSNQLLERQGNEVVTEMFMAGLDTYVSIMAEWINKGELKDGC